MEAHVIVEKYGNTRAEKPDVTGSSPLLQFQNQLTVNILTNMLPTKYLTIITGRIKTPKQDARSFFSPYRLHPITSSRSQ
jgi:hypothetical protein